MNQSNLTNKQLRELDSLFELVSQRQIKDFGNISANSKADGSLITSCDLWSDKTIVDGLASIAPNEGVLSEEGGKFIPDTKAYWVVDPLDGTTNFAAGIPYWSISVARFVDGRPQSSFLIIPTLKKKFLSIKGEGVWLNNKKIEPHQNNHQSECISLCSRSIKILQKKPNSVFPGKIRLLGVSSLNLTSVAMGQTFGAIESTPKIWDIAASWLILEELNCFIDWLETDPLNLVAGQNLSDVNFPLIACRTIEKIEILKPWANLLLEK
ncbi:inositol monophosphatase family protein [Prochlorococcus marinus]|uniref:inositol monophosphatase family protein n=1 Tax=Prochlorococcus marinus TaxID=1219 RepID=UPI001ADA923B|nr:inositol monophosphatase family protein [Prochlorococcus marinus]MBO8203662.1 inositol phosphatase [Prochlorococcus marinus CUG1415]MBW3044817.1 inositol phosphatase [Prochlorococcus marinus str. MU1415]